MRIRILSLLIITSLTFFTSCDNDENSLENENMVEIEVEKEIEIKTWNLKNIKGGFAGVDIDFTEGQIKWIFSIEDHTLIVENTINTTETEIIYTGLESGNYNYTLVAVNGETFIKIENFGNHSNKEYGKYEINEKGELIINKGEGSISSVNDDYILTFK